jgi:Na+/H+ antiporter NhaD/arsenite permease-like protein
MFASLAVFGVTYILIATEKMDKTAAALLGASVAIMFGLVPYEAALRAVDLNVVFLLVGMMLVVNIMAKTGVFEWIAVRIAQAAKGDGLRILISFLLATVVLSAFLDNVTTVILIAPITILICEILELPAVPFLILEALASNIGGAATLVGDPPNVLIASKTKLSFNEFLVNLGPPVVVMMAFGVLAAIFFFRHQVRVPEANKQRIMRARPERAILDPVRLRRALIVFGLLLGGFFASHALGIEPGIIALAGALVMALVCQTDLHHALEKVEWNSVFFFVGLFMLIGALEHNHVFETLGHHIAQWTQGNFLLTVMVVLWFAAVASAIVDNIPLVIAMIPLIQTIVPDFAADVGLTDPALIRAQIEEPLYWSLALGACLGGNGSLVGASANVVVAQIGKRNNYPLTFWAFTRYGFPTMIGTTAIASVYLYLRYFW